LLLFGSVIFSDTEMTTPRTLWRLRNGGLQTIHVVASVAVIAEEQLVVVVGRPAESTRFAFNTLPSVLLNGLYHVRSELETSRMS